jgi:hypothetical protein
MKRPLLFAELCAGTAAVSLKLEGGRHARPPVSRLGSKQGYAEAILKVMGLRCGLGATRYLWCDPDPGVRLLLEAYRDHDLALAAAEIIRGWKDEEPRALWERLKAEGPVRAPEPREVARWCWVATRSRQGIPKKGFQVAQSDSAAHDGGPNYQPTTPADRVESLPTIPADIHPDATQIHPPCFDQNTGRAVVFIDPPYQGTTGYGHDLPRAEVVRLARAWADAGADVYISEAEPIGTLVEDGWHVVEITDTRKGQKRTFSAQKREFLTCSRAPAWTPGSTRQRALFGVEA